MISKIIDGEGKVIAYAEWRQVGQSGFDKFQGEYIWINELWMHKSLHNSWETYRTIMNQILFKAMDAKWLYFRREKYNGRVSKLYSRSQIMKLLSREMVGV